MLKHLLERVSASYTNFEANEELDYKNLKETKYVKEWVKYTPLMLCAAGGDKNLEAFKLLLKYNADYSNKDIYNNNLLHIAAQHNNNKILEYISKNLKIDIFERNNFGETALNICT